ncbi:MAG: hypothetical protein ABI981_01755 [Betaproteobacteria bacterium]
MVVIDTVGVEVDVAWQPSRNSAVAAATVITRIVMTLSRIRFGSNFT